MWLGPAAREPRNLHGSNTHLNLLPQLCAFAPRASVQTPSSRKPGHLVSLNLAIHPSIPFHPSIHPSIHPFIHPPIHPSIHPSTTILVTLAGPAQTSSEEMRARGRDEQEESVRAAASQRGASCTRPCPTCGHTGSDPSACLCRQCMRPCCSSVCEARHLAGLAGYVPCRGPLNEVCR